MADSPVSRQEEESIRLGFSKTKTSITKEMTRDCNMYSSTQYFTYNIFNYLYANANRPAWSSSTPDDQTNPGRLLASHKESILPLTKLAHLDTGQLGSLGNSRVLNRPHPHTIPSITTPPIQLSKETMLWYHRRNGNP